MQKNLFEEWQQSNRNSSDSNNIIERIRHTYEKLLLDKKLVPIEQLNLGYARFAEKFSPDRLKNLDGELLLNTIFNISNRSSMFYWLEFKNDEEFNTFDYGSIAGGSSFKYIMFKRNADGKWVTGNPHNPTVLTIEQAINLGREIRDTLIAGAEEIKALENNPDESEYANLVKSQQETLLVQSTNTEMYRLGWVHKYYHMLYSHLIDDFHSIRWQRHGLICCGIKPNSDSLYGMAGQYIKLAKECDLHVSQVTSTIRELFGSPVNYFRIGTSDGKTSYWNDMRTGGYVSIGWSEIDDLREYEEQDKTSLKAKLTDVMTQKYPNTPQTIGRQVNQLLSFYFNIQPQDVIVAVNGERVLGVGRVIGRYEYRQGMAFPHQIKVDWIHIADTRLPNPQEGILTTVYQYKDTDNQMAIEKLVNTPFQESSVMEADVLPLSPLKGIDLLIEKTLNRKKQVILYGPPGTGKTYHAEKVCFELAARHNFNKAFAHLSQDEQLQVYGSEDQKGFVRICCFHPSYGYEDFIEGIKPSVTNGQTVFELVDGIFKEICLEAIKQPDKNFYLIIDEINRGDISRIFGELIMLIEVGKRGKNLVLPLSKKQFTVPDNVYVVGTMNTADRSIALLDVALRRRFGFTELMPDYRFFEGIVFDGLPLDAWLKGVNERICEHIGKDGRNLQIGHSYFLEKGKAVTDQEKFKSILKEDIIPLIEEYCYGDYSLLAKILGDRIVDVKNQSIRHELFMSSDFANLINALLYPSPELRAATEEGHEDESNAEEEDLIGDSP